MASVQIQNVRKVFGEVVVLHGVSVDIADGEFVVLVGPSGCGKSTLLRTIAGLETVTTGDIHIGSRSVNGLAPKDRDIAMVFQSYALYPQMTVAQNMSFSLELSKASKADIATKVDHAAKILGLEPLLARYPRQLSGGQRQRVAMGRAIVRNPQVFLFDEPLSNLDATLRVQMRAEIKSLQRRLGTTTIYVTHDQIEAMTMADKIVVLRGGKVEQIGAPLELYDRPANRFVASFIGSPSMNFIDGVVANDGQGFLAGKEGVRMPVQASPLQARGTAAVLGVRPEHIVIDPNGVPAEVLVVEPTGAETHLVVSIAGQQVMCVLKDRVSIKEGAVVPLGFNAALSHFFHPETHLRLA